VAGMLLFSRNPQAHQALSFATIRVGRFRGIKKGLLLDQSVCVGTLQNQLRDAVHFALKNSRLTGEIDGIVRQDVYEYPEVVLREVITNALVHRDYTVQGAAIELALFDDRLEVITPGGLPGSVTISNIADRQYSRNPIIAKRMFEMGFFDSWGQGIDLILEWAESHGTLVQFFDDGNEFKIILYSPMEARLLAVSEVPVQYAGNRGRVIEYLKSNQTITNAQCRELLNLSKMQVQSLFGVMEKANQITRIGQGRAVCYSLSRV
jgi:ATP-dependent DNA helicase RecG